MEIVTTLISALVGGLIAWLIAGWQFKRQAADMREQIREQARLAQTQARADMQLRLQVEEYQALAAFQKEVSRNFGEIYHHAGNLARNPTSEFDHETIVRYLQNTRRLVRGESEAIGDDLAKSLMEVTDMWAQFLSHPQEARRREVLDLHYGGTRRLHDFIDDKRQALGVGLYS